jgi:hypothetical protein
MKQNAGLIAALTVFLAFFGMSNLPKSTPSSGGTETKTKTNAPKNRNKNGQPENYAACEEIRHRLQPLVNQPTLDDWHLPDSCYSVKKAPTSSKPMSVSPGLHFVIATAPNPISTHLPLLFDRAIEIIHQAAQDDNYSYDSSWFPWDEAAKEYPLLGDQQTSDEAQKIQQTQPGVVVFRRALKPGEYDSPYLGGLVVFVVAEQPTGGIDRDQFENALTWIERLGALTPQRGLKILGPVFSGSLPSLARALGSKSLASFAQQKHIYISSGSVSSELSFGWFQKFLESSGLGTFETAIEGDTLMAARFCKYLQLQHYRLLGGLCYHRRDCDYRFRPDASQCHPQPHHEHPARRAGRAVLVAFDHIRRRSAARIADHVVSINHRLRILLAAA